MKKPVIEEFLENNNMHYLFCLLSNLEVQRLNNLPTVVRQKFEKKITETAMDHVASNLVPDYIIEHFEEEVESRPANIFQDDEDDEDDDEVFVEEIMDMDEDMDSDDSDDFGDDFGDDED